LRPNHPVAIAGAGVLAQALGRALSIRGATIVALASRSRSRAEQAAAFVGPLVQAVEYSDLPRLASHVIVAVSDEGIAAVAQAIAAGGMRSGVALHTCGARGAEALMPLDGKGVACGMLHPLQSIATAEQGVTSLQGITFAMAGDPAAIEWAEQLVSMLDGHAIRIAPDRLSWYHAGAAMASNVLVGVIDAAVVLMGEAGLEKRAALAALGPLCRTSLENALRSSPQEALTGPLVRGDAATVAAHLDALAGAPTTVAALYRAGARHLLELARRRGLSVDAVRALESVLADRKVA
jgi:predicted short-subunit dehydrogenase-like oxidoreductase (DUF2520 family)